MNFGPLDLFAAAPMQFCKRAERCGVLFDFLLRVLKGDALFEKLGRFGVLSGVSDDLPLIKTLLPLPLTFDAP